MEDIDYKQIDEIFIQIDKDLAEINKSIKKAKEVLDE